MGDEMSSQFSVVNGIKHGGVLSPLLCAVYIDGLLIRLEETGVGCHMCIRFIGTLAFADDLNLLAPTGLKILIDVCENMLKSSTLSSMDQKFVYSYLREGTVRFQQEVSLLMVYH